MPFKLPLRVWLDIGTDQIEPDEQARRLGVFLEAYGVSDRPAIVAAMLARQASLAAEGRGPGDRAIADWAAECHAWTTGHAGSLVRRWPTAVPASDLIRGVPHSRAQISAPGGLVQVESPARFQAREVQVSFGLGLPPGPSTAS